MKLIGKILLGIILLVVIAAVLVLGFLGFIPGVSALFGANKPRDLGVKYTEADLQEIRTKTQVKYLVLPDTQEPISTRQFSGSRAVTGDFSSAQLTATLNNQPWKLWPYKNVQLKLNGDGSGEISGALVKNRVPAYAASIGVPQKASEMAMKFLPGDTVFYVKMKAALADNKVSLFEPERLEIGRLPVPLGPILALGRFSPIGDVFAQDIDELTGELAKVSNKEALIISYINSRLSSAFGSFYAKKAYATKDSLHFEGTLPETISYTP